MIITLCNGKGGSGKTTLSVLLAAALVEAGHEVALLDTDPQHTATRWIEEIGGLELAQTGKEYGALFSDTAPRLETAEVRDSIRRADVVVLVTSPSPADLFTSRDTATLIHREGAKDRAHVLFNQVQPGTILARDLDDRRSGLVCRPSRTSSVGGRHINMRCSWVGNHSETKPVKSCSRWRLRLSDQQKRKVVKKESSKGVTSQRGRMQHCDCMIRVSGGGLCSFALCEFPALLL